MLLLLLPPAIAGPPDHPPPGESLESLVSAIEQLRYGWPLDPDEVCMPERFASMLPCHVFLQQDLPRFIDYSFREAKAEEGHGTFVAFDYRLPRETGVQWMRVQEVQGRWLLVDVGGSGPLDDYVVSRLPDVPDTTDFTSFPAALKAALESGDLEALAARFGDSCRPQACHVLTQLASRGATVDDIAKTGTGTYLVRLGLEDSLTALVLRIDVDEAGQITGVYDP